MLLRQSITAFLVGILAIALPAQGAIFAVSGQPTVGAPNQLTSIGPAGIRTDVAVNLANGFPVWYQDHSAGNKYELCLDSTLEVAPGVVVNPCEYEPPLGGPPSFPGNFGAEAIYWSGVALGTYTSSDGTLNSALLVLALEVTGANEAALADGTQAAFSRIRLRLDAPRAGTYRVTHPYGTRDYVVTTPGGRAINQTQDFGLIGPDVAQNFLAAMPNGVAPVEPVPFIPSIDAGIINGDGLNIGPFLVPAATPFDPATFLGGPVTFGNRSYIGLPFAPNPANPLVPLTIEQPVIGSPLLPPAGGNFLRIELIADAAGNPPDIADGSFGGFFLNAANNSQAFQVDDFLLIGKLFNDGPNLAPVALNDTAAAAKNRSTSIDVVGNDSDLISASNVHGINPQGLAVANPLTDGPIVGASGMPAITAEHPTTAGGTVRRTINASTGKATFLYTPRVDFTGIDTFRYVVQDSGGLISTPATVTITVEELLLGQADYRAKTGKWKLSGSSSDPSDNRVTLTANPRASLNAQSEVATPAVTSTARGSASVRVSDSAIEFVLNVDPLPTTAVTAAHIHVGAPGVNGPVIFSLYQSGVDAPFSGRISGSLQAFDLQTRPAQGVSSFSDAVNAILNGNAYINVHTAAFPSGEIRGQLTRPVIGTAEVSAAAPNAGQWEFKGHSTASPGALPGLIIESANGIRLLGNPLRLR